MAQCIWARGLVRIWQQPPKLQVGGPNPPAPAFGGFKPFSKYLYILKQSTLFSRFLCHSAGFCASAFLRHRIKNEEMW